MSQGEIRVDDVGTTFILTIKDQDNTVVDVSSASTKKILFEKPDGTTVFKTASFTTDGTDGKIQYAAIADDLDLAGPWKMQGKVVIGTSTWKTDVQKFTVYSNLTEPS